MQNLLTNRMSNHIVGLEKNKRNKLKSWIISPRLAHNRCCMYLFLAIFRCFSQSISPGYHIFSYDCTNHSNSATIYYYFDDCSTFFINTTMLYIEKISAKIHIFWIIMKETKYLVKYDQGATKKYLKLHHKFAKINGLI